MEGEVVKAIHELVALDPGANTVAVLQDFGGFTMTAAGAVIADKLITKWYEDLSTRYKKAREADKIKEEFQYTPHGQKLMQDALAALSKGLDQERAEAVINMFLGLAMNPVSDSFGQIEQQDLLRISSELEAWELAFINTIGRYRKEHFDEELARNWEIADSSETRDHIKGRGRAIHTEKQYHNWLLISPCDGDKSRYISLEGAFASLKKKSLVNGEYASLSDISVYITYRRNCPFTAQGQKLVAHLFSAKLENN